MISLEESLRALLAEPLAPVTARLAEVERKLDLLLERGPVADTQPPAQEPPPVTAELPPAADPPVVVTPAQPVTGALAVEIMGAGGKPWSCDLSAAARQDALGLRAMVEVPAEVAGCTSLRLVAALGAWAFARAMARGRAEHDADGGD